MNINLLPLHERLWRCSALVVFTVAALAHIVLGLVGGDLEARAVEILAALLVVESQHNAIRSRINEAEHGLLVTAIEELQGFTIHLHRARRAESTPPARTET